MSNFATCLALAFLALLAPDFVGEPKLDWKGHRVTLAEAKLAEQKAPAALVPWAAEHGYGASLSEDARVLAIAKGVVTTPRGLAERVLAFQDGEFGKRDAKATLVVLQIASDADWASLLAAIGKALPDLARWCASAKENSGFLLPESSIGALLEKPSGIKGKEWHATNELVNRVALLDLFARFGRLPYWIECGFAWHAEIDVCGGVYCFPGRSGFVAVGEHRGWAAALASSIAARSGKALEIGELAGVARGNYDANLAPRAWGTAEFLVRFHKPRLAALFAALGAIRDHDGRTTHADGSWESVQGYEIPADKQLELFEREIHPEFLAELTRYFAEGSSFVPKDVKR